MIVLVMVFLQIHTNFENVKFHFHQVLHNCKGEPDAVYRKSEKIYYACIKGKDVCSEEPGSIPYYLINNFDAANNAARKSYRGPVATQVPAVKQAQAVSPWPSPAAVPAPTIPAPAPPARIAEGRLLEVPIGSTRDEVIQKLGNPYMKITGQVESFTYLLTSGSSAKLDLENGKLIQLRVIPSR
jgi:hypothetical protein